MLPSRRRQAWGLADRTGHPDRSQCVGHRPIWVARRLNLAPSLHFLRRQAWVDRQTAWRHFLRRQAWVEDLADRQVWPADRLVCRLVCRRT